MILIFSFSIITTLLTILNRILLFHPKVVIIKLPVNQFRKIPIITEKGIIAILTMTQ
jgi:hypothetical protein